jgi:antiviral defense system Shedu protein SduA
MATDDPTVRPADESGKAATSDPLVVQSRAFAKTKFPDLEAIHSVVLRDSKRVRKEANYLAVRDRHAGSFHHNELTIQTINKRKSGEVEDEKHTICLTNEDGDEIKKLSDFLVAVLSGSVPKQTSKYVVLPIAEGKDGKALQQLVSETTDAGKVDILAHVFRHATRDTELFQVLLSRAEKDPGLFAEAVAALNLAMYRRAVRQLEKLIATEDVREEKFQTLLTKHPWMFGSEYSEILDRRRWTRDENQDFVVRRTTDNYLELIEIKTPLNGKSLFNCDNSHDSFYPGVELSKVIGQVAKYVEKLDADRNSILANDAEDTSKIRAKIIIGRDGDQHQRTALRRHNGHLHRIEIITFDQLVKIAQRVLQYLENAFTKKLAPPS